LGSSSFRRIGSFRRIFNPAQFNLAQFIPARAKSGAVHLGAIVQSGALVQTAAHKKFSFL
jgi:hypothetical protein